MGRLPRVFLVRHGETEWTINGRHTGTTDLPLTENGEAIIKRLGEKVAGPGKLIDPSSIGTVMVSPRTRAQRTFELLFAGVPTADRPKMQIDERVREWTYGDYEGKLKEEVSAQRGAPWDIWTQGCAGGESAEQMCVRADDVVRAIRDAHRTSGKDVLLVSHGHFSRVFLARWLGLPLPDGQKFVLDPGGVCVCQYYHDLEHPAVGAINLGVL